MPDLSSRPVSRSAIIAALGGMAFLGACAAPQPKSMVGKHPKEYFAESKYGVKASPRVSNLPSRLPRGGGRDQLGKPYVVAGKWYYPKEDKNYRKVGAASWYGDAFHGRLTANGEIYDQTHLTAAHPTMPLPSYARVTNLVNGSSVIVRVNDRGPYHDGRIIDLSRRAAEMLDYSHTGIAKVEVDYVGRAPLDGRDDEFLMASYRPGRGAIPLPGNDGLPEGVMVAMNGPTPTSDVGAGAPFPGQDPDAIPMPRSSVAAGVADAASTLDLPLPAVGPRVPERPEGVVAFASKAIPLGYADERFGHSTQALAGMAANGLTPEAIEQSWKRTHGASAPYVAVGTFGSLAEAQAQVAGLSGFGRVEIQKQPQGDQIWYTVTAAEDGRADLDSLLEKAWQAGATNAMVVRD